MVGSMIRALVSSTRPAALTVCCVVCLVVAPGALSAQTASQLAAWAGLTLSPTGSVSPLARDPLFAGVPGSSVSARYGRWQYDADDAVHDNFGLTWSRRFAYRRTELSLTGAYTLVECGTCSAWQMVGVGLRSTIYRRVAASDPEHAMRFGAAVTMNLGYATFKGAGRASTFSVVSELPLEASFPLYGTSSFRVTLLPGLGYGTISSDGRTDGGIIPIYGGALGWAPSRRFAINVGIQRPVIPRSTAQVGVAFSWEYRMPKAGIW
jgi:hypothetical protein